LFLRCPLASYNALMPRHLACLLPLLLLPAGQADTAVLATGQRVSGTASVRRGKLAFTPRQARDKFDFADLVAIDLGGSAGFFRAGPAHRLTLAGGQRLSGVFLGMEKDRLLLRTAWASRLAVPRSALVSLTHLPGWRTLLAGDFAAEGWKLAGKP